MTAKSSVPWPSLRIYVLLFVIALVLMKAQGSGAQSFSYSSGQNVSPAFEGWEKNPDGSFNLLFGYMNRNWEEEINVPVGPDNNIGPGVPDQGQPTHFLPRRNRFVFKVRVPTDFGAKELVWTLTTKGKTERAYATLRPDYFLDTVTIMSERGAIGGGFTDPVIRANKGPVLRVQGEKTRSVKMGQSLTLIAAATDDGVPKVGHPPGATENVTSEGQLTASAGSGKRTAARPPAYGVPRVGSIPYSAVGLRVVWYVYRGTGKVTFDPPQFKVWEDTRDGANSPWAPRWTTPPMPPDGRIMVRATFSEPGTYVLRCLADDGGLWADEDIAVTVTP